MVTTEEFLKYIGREDLIEKEDESEKIERCDVCQMFPKIEGSNKCKSCHYCVKHFIETSPEFAKYREKTNYSPEEIELVKHNINQREVTEQGSELLKFDMLEENKVDIAIKSFTFFRDEIIERIASFERKNKGIKVVFDEKKFFSIIDADKVENN